MKAVSKVQITDQIADALSQEYGHRVTQDQIVSFDDDGEDPAVDDGTRKYLVPTKGGDQGFFIISGAGNPGLIKRATDNIAFVRSQTPTPIADAILPPLTTGEINGFSYAIWPGLRPFNQDNRLLHYIRCRRFESSVLDWSLGLTKSTLKPADPDTFGKDLNSLAQNTHFPEAMRQAAQIGADKISTGKWHPQSCIDHGDFWSGNLLLPKSKGPLPFYVIDWPGMRREGYPFWDMIRILMSLKSGLGLATGQIRDLGAILGEDPVVCLDYVLASIGHFGRNLEYFPEDLYHSTSTRIYRYMTKIGAQLA